ncbi:MAG: DUF3570 domain-containing protein [candidate division KSB1 bacterium]
MHKLFRLLLMVVVLCAVLGIASTSFTDDSVALKTNFFTDSGGLLVRSPSLWYVKELAQNSLLSLQYTMDRVRIPPYRGISAKPVALDGTTGASKPAADSSNGYYSKTRNELTANLTSQRWNLTAYFSRENDYTGRLFSAGYNQDFHRKNTNLALGLGYGYDTITPIGRNRAYPRRNLLANATVTQTLSPVTLMRFGMDVSYVTGYQNNPYRTVFVLGSPTLENHPRERLRLAGFAKFNTYFRPARAALWLDYRLYGDDWGILSNTFGVKLHQQISPRLLMRYRYRFYTQTAADFYRANYPLLTTSAFYTDDYKLEAFYSHLFGFMISYGLEPLGDTVPFLANSTLDVKYERFFTSNVFTANIYQIGVTVRY